MTYDPQNLTPPGAKIKVIGVGGGGGNAINTMIRSGLEGVDFVSCNTDVQSLRFSLAPAKIQVGKELTRGLGAGADPDVGRDAALEDRHEIQELLTGADMVFITAGMGGGTGTGGASVVAQIARELGALTVAVVTKPFQFEGNRRRRHAEAGVARLRECVDTLITIPNQRLLQVAAPGLSMIDAFKMADEVLVNAVRGISDIINIPGTVNVDFADVKTVMSCMGHALMGIGHAVGEKRAVEAARMAVSSPLLEDIDIEGATGILINITAGANVTLMEVNEACSIIQEAAHEDANIIFGAVIDETLGDQIRVTVIATGFPVDDERGRDTASCGVVKTNQQILQPFASRLTTPSLVTTNKAVIHRPPSQHIATYAPKRPEPVKQAPTETYAFHGQSLATPTFTAPVPEAKPEPQFSPEPTAATPEAAEPKDFFSNAADLAPAAPVFEPQIHAESETHDLTRLTMEGTGLGTFGGSSFDDQKSDHTFFNDGFAEASSKEITEAAVEKTSGDLMTSHVEPVAEPITSLANPLLPVEEAELSLGMEAAPNEQDFFAACEAGSDDILMTEPESVKIISPNEPEVIIKASCTRAFELPNPFQAANEHKDLKIEGASAVVDPTDDFLSPHETSQQPAASTTGSLFEDFDDFSTATSVSTNRNFSRNENFDSAPLDSFFSNETAAIAGDIDRKINEALELAERMKNPTDVKGQRVTTDDDLDVPAFLRNGMKDLPLG
jgi:cell division protein FtsZ